MTSTIPFFLSRIIGAKVYGPEGYFIGTVKDLLLGSELSTNQDTFEKPVVQGISIQINKEIKHFSFEFFESVTGYREEYHCDC